MILIIEDAGTSIACYRVGSASLDSFTILITLAREMSKSSAKMLIDTSTLLLGMTTFKFKLKGLSPVQYRTQALAAC